MIPALKCLAAVRVAPAALLALVFAAGLSACAPQKVERGYAVKSLGRVAPETAPLSRMAAVWEGRADGRSGIDVIDNGIDAMALRLALIGSAQSGIDAQYYLLENDRSGALFVNALLQAADRGVRVRLLLDDLATHDYDPATRALTEHPNVEVRLFNPIWRNRGKLLSGVLEFQRINHRMHNKSLVVDGRLAVVGGRNIADAYFTARPDSNFVDIDVLAAGPVVAQVGAVFDDYWNSPYAASAETVVAKPSTAPRLVQLRRALLQRTAAISASSYGALLGRRRQAWADGAAQFTAASVELLADPPDKLSRSGPVGATVAGRLLPQLRAAREELIVISPYFLPQHRGRDMLAQLRRDGVAVTVLTNSLAATDVPAVHGHYAPTRAELLGAGVDLWELGPVPSKLAQARVARASLHAKAYVIDRRKLFVGSFNWDPRSQRFNTEMGLLISSPRLAAEAAQTVLEDLPQDAFRLVLDPDQRVRWLAHDTGRRWRLFRHEPAGAWPRGLAAALAGVLPLAGQL